MKNKAGCIPFFIEDGQVYMKFMKPSNPAYGGPRFQIAKGHIDAGENPATAGVREAGEELGLRFKSIKKLIKGPKIKVTGVEEESVLHVFLALIDKDTKFNRTDYEVGATKWMTPEEFASKGRKEHVAAVKAAAARIKKG
jgi:8-oxo-dGTP pyrophosphatase MutT (NUDIX family)